MFKTYIPAIIYNTLLFPLNFGFSYLFKGKKDEYKNFFSLDLKEEYKNIEEINSFNIHNFSFDIKLSSLNELNSKIDFFKELKNKEILINIIYENEKLDTTLSEKLKKFFTQVKPFCKEFAISSSGTSLNSLSQELSFYKFTQFILDENFSDCKLISISSQSNNPFLLLRRFYNKFNIRYGTSIFTLALKNKNTPEYKEFGLFDFSKGIDYSNALSNLSAKSSNGNINLKIEYKEEIDLNYLLRACLLAYSSEKIDKLFLDINYLKTEKEKKAFIYMKEQLKNAKIKKFSKSKNLHVLTCENKTKNFDIIWSSSNREIELTDFNKVYDKFGTLLEKDIVISTSPIYALHK